MNDQHEPTCLTHTNPDAASLVAAAALGEALSPADSALLDRIQAACAQCRSEYRQFTQIARELPLTLAPATPAANLRARILAEAQRTPTFSVQKQPQAQPARTPRLTRHWAVSGLMAAAVVGLLVWNFSLRDTISTNQARSTRIRIAYTSVFGDEDARECDMQPGNVPTAAGVSYLAPTAEVATVYVKQIPVPPAGSAYHLWLSVDGNTRHVEQLRLDERNRILTVPLDLGRLGLDLSRPAQILVTLESTEQPAQPSPPAALCDL